MSPLGHGPALCHTTQMRLFVLQARLTDDPMLAQEQKCFLRASGLGREVFEFCNLPERVPTLDEVRTRAEHEYLVQVLQLSQGNVSEAARLAGRNRTEFYKLLGRHKLSPEHFK